MRWLPPCGEGFRRLSIVAALVAGISIFGVLVRGRMHQREAYAAVCSAAYDEGATDCAGIHTTGRPCIADADAEYSRCMENLNARTELEILALYALEGFAAAYAAALSIRVIGWVAAGFTRS